MNGRKNIGNGGRNTMNEGEIYVNGGRNTGGGGGKTVSRGIRISLNRGNIFVKRREIYI